MTNIKQIKAGDEIVFKAACRWGAPMLRRRVTEVNIDTWPKGTVGVNAHGCRPFYVKAHEILEVIHA